MSAPTLPQLETLEYTIESSPSMLIPLDETANTSTMEYTFEGSPFVVVLGSSGGGFTRAYVPMYF